MKLVWSLVSNPYKQDAEKARKGVDIGGVFCGTISFYGVAWHPIVTVIMPDVPGKVTIKLPPLDGEDREAEAKAAIEQAIDAFIVACREISK